MSQIFEDFKRILDYIRLIYLPNSNINKKEVHDFYYNLDRYINRNKEKIIQNKDNNIIIEYFVKKLIQFLFYFNLIILKSESSSSIRHYFPPSINQGNSFDLSGEDFYNLINKYFNYKNIGIRSLRPSTKEISYFTINDYESIIKILLFWDNSGKFINKTSEDHQTKEIKLLFHEFWGFKFPNEKIIELREIFRKFEIFIFFNKYYLDQIFGEKGIIKNSKLSISKFLESLSAMKEITRQSIYNWKKKAYIPLTFLIDLINSNYDFDRDFFKNIKFIQIGKSPNKIDKELIKLMKERYNDWLINFIPPPPSSKLGYIFDYDFTIKEKQINFFEEFKKFLFQFSNETLEKNKIIVEKIESFFYNSGNRVILKSLNLKNFKSFETLKVEFDTGINIFYGMNASGKTTIFEAILFSLFYWDNPTYIKIKDLNNVEFLFKDTFQIRDGKEYCRVELEITINNTSHKIKRELFRDGSHKLFIDDQDIFDKIKDSIQIDKFIEKKLKKYEYPKKDFLDIILDEKTTILIHFGKKGPIIELIEKNLLQYLGMSGRYYGIIEFDDKYNQLYVEITMFIIAEYLDFIINEIWNSYKKINCTFSKNEIFSSFFIEYGSIYSGNFLFKELVLKKFEILEYLENYKEENEDSSIFIESCRRFFFKLIVDTINSRLTILAKVIFRNNRFSTFLDEDHQINIYFNDSNIIYPISILSGGEKSKLILILLSILMDISSANNFLLIDEPNELLDPDNIDLIKKYLFKTFKKTQVIIGTYLENYKNFQPALIYEVWKDHNNISHVFHIEDKEKFEIYKKKDEIEKKIEQNPKDYYYNQKRLVLLIRLNRYEEALDFFNNIKDLGLDVFDNVEYIGEFLTKLINLEKKEKSKENDAKYYRIRALLFYCLKELHQAIKNVDEAIKLGSNIPDVYEFKADCLYLTNKPNRALDTIEAGIKLFPEHTGFHATKSKILEILGKYEEALSEIEEAIKVNKDKNWNYYHKALVLTKLERYSEALENIDRAYESNPHDFIYIQDKVNILEKLNKVDEALGLVEKEKNNFADFEQFEAQLYQTKSYQLAYSNKKEEAIETIKKAIKIDPEEANFYDSYGEILMIFNQYEEAVEQFMKAKKLHFTPIQTYINLGKCLYELGQYEDALENLELGKRAATHNVKRIELTEDDRRISVDSPQTKLIKESEKYIKRIKEKSK